MSLSYDFSRIEDFKRVVFVQEGPDEGALNPLTQGLIFGTIAVGLGSITEKNAGEFFARTNLLERIYGPTLNQKDPETGGWKPRPVTELDVAQHVGLRTNASDESRASWVRRVVNGELDRVVREFPKRVERSRK